MDAKERRRHTRIGWCGSVTLMVPGGEPFDATIADITEVGCGLRTQRAVEPGAQVGIEGTGFQGDGVVRYCYPFHGGFRVGVELRPVN